ncbi:MAG: glycine/sarcosine/betaine reductase selenoprotein B family protein [bacterium]
MELEYVPYMDRVRNYYRQQGFENAYRWAHHSDAAFAPLNKPLAQSRVALISTAGFAVAPEGGYSEEELRLARGGGSNTGSYEVEVFPVSSDIAEERIVYVKGNHDRSQSEMADPNSFFPVARLREFRDEGRLGSLATNFYRLKENYSQRKSSEIDAPEVLRLCREDGVDVAVLTPV